jgi:hypothetical protein
VKPTDAQTCPTNSQRDTPDVEPDCHWV